MNGEKRVREGERDGGTKESARDRERGGGRVRNRKNRVHATQIFSLVHSSTILFHYLQINEAIEKQSR